MRVSMILLFFVLFLLGCANEPREYYYSIEKSRYGRHDCDNIETDYGFYRFQNYIKCRRLGLSKMEELFYNIDERVIFSQMKNTYKNKGYDSSMIWLERVKIFNSQPSNSLFMDTSILLLDLYEGITLLSLSGTFATQAWGAGCSGYENYLIKKSSDSVSFMWELHTGKLRGVFINEKENISGLLFEDYSNGYNDYSSFHGSYIFRYNVTEKGLESDNIMNVRNGEPFDYNDHFESVPVEHFGIAPVKFEEKYRLTIYLKNR